MSGYKVARLAALTRDGWRCQVCRGTDQLTAHHRVPRHITRSDHPDGLATLCRACHDYVEQLDLLALYIGWAPYYVKGQ
jgi:5-methylcytosine-specific restriction endonuclease McrA